MSGSISSAERLLLTAISCTSAGSRRASFAADAVPSSMCWRRSAALLMRRRYSLQPNLTAGISIAGLEFARLELERGADVDRLAIATHVLEGRHAIPLDVVAHTAGERDFLRQRIR